MKPTLVSQCSSLCTEAPLQPVLGSVIIFSSRSGTQNLPGFHSCYFTCCPGPVSRSLALAAAPSELAGDFGALKYKKSPS